jgi:hypothetical protein
MAEKFESEVVPVRFCRAAPSLQPGCTNRSKVQDIPRWSDVKITGRDDQRPATSVS